MNTIATVAALAAAYPDLVTQIRTESGTAARAEGETAGKAAGLAEGEKKGHAAGLEEGRKEGATAERTRILGIQAHAVPGTEKIVAEMINDGATTADAAGARILAEVKKAGPQVLAALKADDAPNPGANAGGGDKGDLSAADVATAIKAEIDAAAKDGRIISYGAAAAKVRAGRKAA